MAEWKPAVIDEYMESLLKRGLFRQAMNERLAKVRSGEEREALARVDSYMTGFLSHEWRKASRKKVRCRETAARRRLQTANPMTANSFLDECGTEHVCRLRREVTPRRPLSRAFSLGSTGDTVQLFSPAAHRARTNVALTSLHVSGFSIPPPPTFRGELMHVDHQPLATTAVAFSKLETAPFHVALRRCR